MKVIAKDGDNHLLIFGTHLSFFTSRDRVYLPPLWIYISIYWLWLIECDRKDAAAQDARSLTPFTFCFLEPSHLTVRSLCLMKTLHGEELRFSGWQVQLAAWATPRAIIHPVKKLIQSCPQITAVLVMILGSRRIHQSSHRIMRVNEVIVNMYQRASSNFLSNGNICFVTLVQPLDLPSTFISWFAQWGRKLLLTSYGGSDSMRQWWRIPFFSVWHMVVTQFKLIWVNIDLC